MKKKIRHRIIFRFNIFLNVLTLLAYGSAYIPPKDYGWIGFIPLIIPLFLIYHISILFIYMVFNYKKAWLPGLMLVLGGHFIYSTLSFGVYFNTSPDNSFDVLSYNVRVFNVYPELEQEKPGSPALMIDWLSRHPAEIKCFQEFYILPDSQLFNTLDKFGTSQGYKYQLAYEENLKLKGQYFGVAIFSKLPVLASGEFPLNKYWTRRGVYMDVLFEQDTVRIINVHLQSIAIDDGALYNWDGVDDTQKKYLQIFNRVKKGYQKRSEQITYLEQFLLKQPNRKTILCGDFNDLPYSYAYRRVKNYFKNAFEEAGRGFGFSYNGKIPFLRIDNQFYSSNLNIIDFKTLSQYTYSDHFPLLGKYELR